MPNKCNKTKRVYKCATCEGEGTWHVVVRKLDYGDNLWQVDNTPLQVIIKKHPVQYIHLETTNLPCNCDCSVKGKISDQLFFNVTWVREIVFNNPSGKDVDNLVVNAFATHEVPQKCLPSKAHRNNIIAQLRFLAFDWRSQFYHRLPQYLRKFSINNLLSSVVLQADASSQFYRLFIGFPIAHQHGQSTLPILMVDCFHYQCPNYDGIAIVLTSRTGFGLSVTYAFAIIPVEDTNNIAWFLQLCLLHGIDFDCALFTDQGPLLSAANGISRRFKVKFNLMLCLQHLLRNIFHKFPDLKEHGPKNIVTHSVNEAASSGEMNNFFEIINRMVYSLFQLSIPLLIAVEMIVYILQINPSHWTVFANTLSYDKDIYNTEKKNLITIIYLA